MADGHHALAIEFAGRLVGPEEEDLLNEDDDFVRYARAFHPVELKLLEARYYVRAARGSTRSEPLVTFHLSAAFSALVGCYEILRYERGGEAYKGWWKATRERLVGDDDWQTIRSLRDDSVHKGLGPFKVHQQLTYVERPDGVAVEFGVAHVEIGGRKLTAPLETCAGIIDLLHALIQDAKSNGFLEAPKPDGRTFHVEFVAEDGEGNRRSVGPTELETTKHLQHFGLQQSIKHEPRRTSGRTDPAGGDGN